MDHYKAVSIEWPYNRRDQPVRIRVVEPGAYSPGKHANVFAAVMRDLIAPIGQPLDSYSSVRAPLPPRLDLVTFPEAFVSAEMLIETLMVLSTHSETGCFHVGLRPSTGDNHLFTKSEALDLVGRISQLLKKSFADLQCFEEWLHTIQDDERVNLGCVFMVDANTDLRVFLHPKLVRSQFEASAMPENSMKEGGIVTILRLKPTETRFSTIVVQPLICSDALKLRTDVGMGEPLSLLANRSGRLRGDLPDHVDIVSVVTCTPQQSVKQRDGNFVRIWHEKFRATFAAAQSDYTRHYFATFVLANFLQLDKNALGGVSGIYLPVPPTANDKFPDQLMVSCFGRPKSENSTDNRWSVPEDLAQETWSNRGHLAGLVPWNSEKEEVRMLQSTILVLPRENSLWDSRRGLDSCKIRVGKMTETGEVSFEWAGDTGLI